jgi:hypothetical protein
MTTQEVPGNNVSMQRRQATAQRLRRLRRLRQEGEGAIHAAGVGRRAVWQARGDRPLPREEVRDARRKLEVLGQEVEDVSRARAPILGPILAMDWEDE